MKLSKTSLKNHLLKKIKESRSIVINIPNVKMLKWDLIRRGIHMVKKGLIKMKLFLIKMNLKSDWVNQIYQTCWNQKKTRRETVEHRKAEKGLIALVSVMILCSWMELRWKLIKTISEEREATLLGVDQTSIEFHRQTLNQAAISKHQMKSKRLIWIKNKSDPSFEVHSRWILKMKSTQT